jgi:hypothetical protein
VLEGIEAVKKAYKEAMNEDLYVVITDLKDSPQVFSLFQDTKSTLAEANSLEEI